MRARRNIMSKYTRSSVGHAVLATAGIIALLSLPIGCNRLCNYQNIEKPGVTITSRPKFILGHEDYIKHADGTRELINYSGLGLRMGRMKTYQDTNGDGNVEIIRENCSEIQMHRLKTFWEKTYDYIQHPDAFNNADKEMREAIQKYDK